MSATRSMLPIDLAIFWPPSRRKALCSQKLTNFLPGGGLGLRDLVLVVREDEVHAAGVDVERLAQVPHAHGRAFDVPAGPSRPDGGVPGRLAGLGALPQREVADVVLAVLVRLDTFADAHAVGIEPGEPSRSPARRRSGRSTDPSSVVYAWPFAWSGHGSATCGMCSVARGMTSGVVMPRAAASTRKPGTAGQLADRDALGGWRHG